MARPKSSSSTPHSPHSLFRYIPAQLLLLFNLFPKLTHAQGLAVSATAAWSSQIIAFWGAVIIGVRSCPRALITNPFTAFCANIIVVNRTFKIYRLLQNGDWYLYSGWNNGKTRTDVVILCWKDRADLWKLALQTSMQIESAGENWEVLICGRKLTGRGTTKLSALGRWIQSPRCEGFCGARTSATSQPHFPIDKATVSEAVLKLQTRDRPEEILRWLLLARDKRATRSTYFNEARAEMRDETTPARHVTSLTITEGEIPFIQFQGGTGEFGSSRAVTLKTSMWMYGAVHVTIAVAIGLMGAASGRGLTIWLFLLRPMLVTAGLGVKTVCDSLGFFMSFDNAQLIYESGYSASAIGGDLVIRGMSGWMLLYSCGLLFLEGGVLVGGWLYGALKVTKSKPTGLVGHGMLILATAVGIVLSIRSFMGIFQRRIKGRLIGTFAHQEFVRRIVGRSVEIPMAILKGPMSPYPQLYLIHAILEEGYDDVDSITIAGDILRQPDSGSDVVRYVVERILKYQYNGDAVVTRGDPPISVSARGEYPWFWAALCNLLTAACAVASVAYAYLDMPWWVKLLVEVLLGVSAVGYATLEKTAGLAHNRDCYLSHMVATMVVSAVWYVGVEGVG